MQTIRSFWFMLTMLFWREFTIFKRNPMKGIRVVGNSIVMLVLAGLIFIHGISDNRPVKGQPYTADGLNYYFIKAQGVTFIAIVSCIMSSIFSVSLACKNSLIFSSRRSIDLLQVDNIKKILPFKLFNIKSYYLGRFSYSWGNNLFNR